MSGLADRCWALLAENGLVRLTDAERDAIAVAAKACSSCNGFANDPTIPAVYKGYEVAETLRGLLDRLEPIAAGDNDRPQPIGTSDCPVPDNAPEQDTTPAQGSVPPEWMNRPYLVDPPQGWRYGFPKLYDPASDGDMAAWMVKHGYPQKLADKGFNCTFTAAE